MTTSVQRPLAPPAVREDADAIAERKRARLRAAVAAHTAALQRTAAAPAHAAPAPARAQVRPPASPPPIERILGGEWVETAYGRAFVRDQWYAPDHAHGQLPLAAALDLEPWALDVLANPRTAALHPQPSTLQCPSTGVTPGPRMGFFDIETTGLAGGTGTYVVLAGLGTFEDGGFRLRQYFLADLAAERAMLALMAEDIARCDALVTYNGRAFDVPVMDARLTLARLPRIGAEKMHLDLLHPVRRLYRHRMATCRLAEAERRLLRIERFDDIPGSLIPELYFAYVRAGQAAPLRPVFHHNADDVLSLAGVLARLGRLLADPAPEPDDAAALARWCEAAGDEPRARALYASALPWLDGGEDWPWAAARQARLCRRAGAHDEAAALWSALWADGDATAGLSLAKHLEHRAHDYGAAGDVVRALAAQADPGVRAELHRRLARIARKAARAAHDGSRPVRRCGAGH